MLQQSGQIPPGMFDTNPHQNMPGSFEAGKSHCITRVGLQDQMTRLRLFLGGSHIEAL